MPSRAFDSTMLGHRVFRTVLTALAYPGRPQESPLAPLETGDFAGATAGAVVDAVWEKSSDVVLVEGEVDPHVLRSAPRGSDDRPQLGATVLAVAKGDVSTTAVTLEGPGIDGVLSATLPLSRDAVAARNEACASFPMGIDCIFVDSSGTITALPRTTRVSAR